MRKKCDAISGPFRKRWAIALIIIALQLCLLLIAGGRKADLNIDEVYSYIISNSYRADKITHDDRVFGQWFSGNEMDEFVEVCADQRFAYGKAYYNTSQDCHPPLYYWSLHTICSLFPDTFSIWMGYGLNIFFFVMTQILVFAISDKWITGRKWSYLPLLLYGFSPVAMGCCLFIRMYMLLTMFAALFIYEHVLMFSNGVRGKYLLAVWLTIFLGSFTQYYFVIFSFWGVLLYALWLLRKKEIKHCLLYGFGALMSVGLMVLLFPYVIRQATGSETNNVGKEVMRNLFNVKLWLRMTVSLLKELLRSLSFQRIISGAVAVGTVLLTGYGVLDRFKKGARIPVEYGYMVTVFALTFLSISFIGGEYVYLRYIYFICPLLYISVAAFLEFLPGQKLQKTVMVALVLFSITNGAYGVFADKVEGLELNAAREREKLSAYTNYPLVVMMEKRSTAIPTGNFTKIRTFDTVYMDIRSNIEKEHVIKEGLEISESGKCVVYVPTDREWIKGYEASELFEELQDTKGLPVRSIASGSLGEYFLVG